MKKTVDLSGEKFGRLLVIEKAYKKKDWYYTCKCDCGTEKVIRGADMKGGKINSCGCLAREIIIERNFKHGLSNTRLNSIWRDMRRRCSNPNTQGYKWYGARGIKVCEEWNKNFMSFYNWAINNGYQEDLTLERIDNDGPYSPDNCRWATTIEQGFNKTTSHKITFNGITKCTSQWSKDLGGNPSLVQNRINKLGWSVEHALTTPKRDRHAPRKRSLGKK